VTDARFSRERPTASLAPTGAELGAAPRRASLALFGVPALAAALAFAVWWLTPRLGALAPYALDVVDPPGAVRAMLASTTAAHVELASGRGLTLVLRALSESEEAVEVKVLLDGASASAPPKVLPVPVKSLPAGALQLTLSGNVLPAGGRLRVLIGRAGRLPGSPSGTAAHGRDWQRFDVAFDHGAP